MGSGCRSTAKQRYEGTVPFPPQQGSVAHHRRHLPGQWRHPLLMILAGGGMVVGNQVSALLADRFKPGRFTCYLQFLAAAALLLTFFLAPFGWVSVVLMFICCACLFGIGSPEQFLIVKHAKGGEMLGGCCIQGAFNLGNAMGAFLGGIPVAMGLGYNFPALIGVPMALAGAICLLIFHKKYE